MKKAISFAVVLLLVTLSLCSCSGKSGGVGSTGISAEEFDQLWLDMTDEKVNDIIGGKGELISESEEEDDNYLYFISRYRYEGEIGGYAELEFTQKVSKNIYDHIGIHDDSLKVRLSSKTKHDLE